MFAFTFSFKTELILGSNIFLSTKILKMYNSFLCQPNQCTDQCVLDYKDRMYLDSGLRLPYILLVSVFLLC